MSAVIELRSNLSAQFRCAARLLTFMGIELVGQRFEMLSLVVVHPQTLPSNRPLTARQARADTQ